MPRLPRPRRTTETLADARWGLARLPRRIWRGIRGLWFNRSLTFRRRSALVALILALYLVVRFVSVPGLPCELSPAEECPPSDDAVALVPSGSYAYLHLNLDRDSSQFEQAEELAGLFPHFTLIAQGSLRALDIGPRLALREEVAPWIGDEAAFAEIQAGAGRPRPLVLLAVDDERGAERFEAALGGSGPRKIQYRDVEVRVYRSGLVAASLDGFLALGSSLAVRSAIGAEQGKLDALSSSEQADAVRDGLPDNRLVDAYVSADGIDRLLAGRGGLASQLDTFTDFGASRGVAAAVVAHDDGFELRIDSALDPAKLKAQPGFFTAFPRFDPSLAGELSPDTLLYLGIADPAESVRRLLDQANAAAPGLVDAFDRFNRSLRRRGGGDLLRQVLPVLDGEAAFAIAPARPLPYLTFIFKDVDEQQAREQMARLQTPVIATLNPARTGQAPTFGQRKVGDVVVRSVRLSPALALAYAIFDGKLVVSTNPVGVRQAIEGDESLSGTDGYDTATSGASDSASALVFLNLEGLI
jgi:hypothetical protein